MTNLPPFYNLPTEQREAMLFIVDHIKKKGHSPSLEEIGNHRGRVVPAVQLTVKRLKEKGWLTYERHTARSIALTEKTMAEIKEDEND